MPKTLESTDEPPESADGSSHRQLSAMIDAGRSFSGHERNCVFLNTHQRRFANLSAGSGLDFPDDGRAVAVTDWDHDGDLDLWFSNRNAPRLRLMRNETQAGNHFISILLKGDGQACNADAIGARVEVRLTGDKGGERLVKSLRAGEGFLSQSSKWLHFGLGKPEGIGAIEVRWPDGKVELFRGIEIDRRFVLERGSGTAEAVPRRDAGKIAVAPQPALVAATTESARIPAVTLLRAPKLNLRRPDGTLTGVGQGRSLLINLWATWCAPCVQELAEFRDRAGALQAAGVDVVALSVDGLGNDASSGGADPATFLAEMKFPFASTAATEPLVNILQQFHDSLAGLNRPLPVPTSFLVDPQGRLAVIYKGAVSVDQVIADGTHSAGALDDRLMRAAPVSGSLIVHPQLQLSRREHEASLQHRFGVALLGVNDVEAAIYHFAAALELDPRHAPSSNQLAEIHLAQQQWNEAIGVLESALENNSEDSGAHYRIAKGYSRLGDLAKARGHYEEALRLNPSHALANFEFAALLQTSGESERSITLYRRGLETQPGNILAANNLAWILATHADPTVRDPDEALEIAQRINEATGDKVPNILDTLGVALAAKGNFEGAIHTTTKAVKIAQETNQDELVTQLERRLASYREGTPFFEGN